MWTLFNYLYRDAGNFKIRGTLALCGQISDDEKCRIELAFESGEFFIAEQIGVPPLQKLLQDGFGGRNSTDHCWHSFEGWEVVETCPTGVSQLGGVRQFVERITSVERWNEDLSPEFNSI